MASSEPPCIDINHRLFSIGHDPTDLVDLDAIIAQPLDKQLPARPTEGALLALCPPIYYSLSQGIADNRRLNDRLIAIAAKSGDRTFAVAEPKYGEATRAEIQRVAQLGALGLVWSPRAQGLFADDRLLAELCEWVVAQGMISMIRSAPYSINESLPRIWRLAAKCPRIPLIVVGAFASWENIQAIQQNVGQPGNIFYDISGVCAARDLSGAVAAIGSERFLFGSDGPDAVAATCAVLEDCQFDDGTRQAIMAGNAATLLKL